MNKFREELKSISFVYNLYKIIKELKNRSPRIAGTAILPNKKFITIGKNVDIWDYVIIKSKKNKIIIGNNSQINPFTVIYVGAGVEIGQNVMIAPHVMIAGGIHEYRDLSKPMRFAGSFSKGKIIIEDDVWIGANAVITSGVKIGKGAIIGAGTVITKDISSYDVIVGENKNKILFNRIEEYSNQ